MHLVLAFRTAFTMLSETVGQLIASEQEQNPPRDAYARHFLSVATFELCQAICSRFLVCSTFLVCSRFLESARICSRENPWFVRDFRPNVREKPVKNVKIIFWKRECSRFRWPRPFVQDFGLTRAFVQHLGKVARTSKCKTKTLTNASLGWSKRCRASGIFESEVWNARGPDMLDTCLWESKDVGHRTASHASYIAYPPRIKIWLDTML